MRYDIFTTLPQMFEGPLTLSIIKRAVERGLIEIRLHDLRRWAADRHRTTDDYPYGGGAGMVMKPEPIFAAVEGTLGEERTATRIVAMSASGRLFNQRAAEELAASPRLALICGHYEGMDQRAIDGLQAEEMSIGDYVLSGGELAAMVVVDAVSRLVPGVIDAESRREESHTEGLLEYPHYTRPAVFRGLSVPEVLLSGNHAAIEAWRREQAVQRTRERRPDLYGEWLRKRGVSSEE